jgi:hypothetical protein
MRANWPAHLTLLYLITWSSLSPSYCYFCEQKRTCLLCCYECTPHIHFRSRSVSFMLQVLIGQFYLFTTPDMRNTVSLQIATSFSHLLVFIRAGWSWVQVPVGAGNFSVHHRLQTALGPSHPPIQWLPEVLCLGVKRSGHEADNSPPSSAKVKNAWRYTYTPPIRLHCVVLSSKKAQGL